MAYLYVKVKVISKDGIYILISSQQGRLRGTSTKKISRWWQEIWLNAIRFYYVPVIERSEEDGSFLFWMKWLR